MKLLKMLFCKHDYNLVYHGIFHIVTYCPLCERKKNFGHIDWEVYKNIKKIKQGE
jgi:hypothetical protein